MRSPKVSLFSFCAALTLLWSCSTTNHAILPTQAYHDITAHYNAYFNANEKLKNVYKLSHELHKDKFDSVLPVYHYNDSKEFASHASELDDAVKRSTLSIQQHNISNWSDDNFLLIGQAHYLKGDYDKASSSFKYITTEFKEGVDYVKVMKGLGKPLKKYVKKKKKKKKPQVKVIVNKDGTQTLEKIDKRPKFSLWIHEPARSEALIWLIKTYSRQNKFDEAASVVTYTRGDDLFYKNLEPQIDLVDADLQVSKKDYGAAIEPLEKYLNAKKIKKRKKLRVRPLFVLAQCYAAVGNNAKAIANYKLVLKSRPNYDMEFYAKIKMAKLGRGGDGNDIRKLLARMAKDGKYKEYYDQVYYELALLSIKENNRVEARKFLHRSIDNSTANDDQKALSFLTLAELDYQDEAYVSSKFFYDSTMSFMAKNDLRYADIAERAKVLDNLVTQLNIIAQEDSLQKLAALPEALREKAIRDAVFRKEEEDEAKKAAAQGGGGNSQLSNFANNNQPNQQQNAQQGIQSSWYFYNATARATGYNDYIKKWGRRKLEENWRRKDKSTVSTDDNSVPGSDTASTASKDSAAAAISTGSMEDQIRAGIPSSPEKLDKSNGKLIDAYYTAGTIYKDGLESYAKAEGMFETLNSRFPKNKLLLESYYNLYLLALKQKQYDKAEVYKSKILSEFPESTIAKVLRNPAYLNEAKMKEKVVLDYYQTAYNDYANNQLDSAWYKCEMADVLFKPNPISAKFMLLEALVLARQNRLADYVQALNKIINTVKDVEVKKAATDLLAALNKSSLPQVDMSKDSTKRDSLNALYFKPDTSMAAVQQKLEEAKVQAKQNGVVVNTDTTKQSAVGNQQLATDTNTKSKTVAVDTATKQPFVVAEDTTSAYTRSDAAIHYFIIYIKDPTAPQSVIMSTMAKVDAFNSSVVPEKRLVSKQVLIDSKNKLLNIRQFKNRDDVMAYFNVIKKQDQLFNDLKPEQFAITCISTINFSTLLSEKNVDEYNKFFKRVYK